MPGDDLSTINPKITEVEIGIRNLRKIKIYPLSIKDQKDVSDLVVEAINGFFATGDSEKKDAEFLNFLIELVSLNLLRILSIVTDENKPEKLLEEIDNEQLANIVEAIYEVNYKAVSKKVESLIEKGKKIFPSMRQ